MFLTIWGGKNSYRFWLGEADGSELWEQGTAAVAAAAATATAQVFSIWQGLWVARDESDSCVLYRHLWRTLFFPFHLCHAASGFEASCAAPISYKHPFPSLSSSVSELHPTPMSTAWLDGIMQKGSLHSPSKGAISILQVLHQKSWPNTKLRRSSHWGHSYWSHLACTPEEDLQAPPVNPRMCSSHIAKLQDSANPLKPLGYPLALALGDISAPDQHWPQPLQRVEAGQCFELEPKHVSNVSHCMRNSWLLAKDKLCQQQHPGLLFLH